MKHYLIQRLQAMMFPEFVNSMMARNDTAYTGVHTRHSNLCYGADYPNSFVDLYISSAPRRSAPAVVYCHGGGYTWGDKVEGDPNAKESGFGFFETLLDAGYHIVSVNYALAPEYPYPIPLIQLDQCIGWLKIHAPKYGIGMDRVILCGGSAGAHLTGQYAALVSNPSYAEEMKLKPALAREKLMAFVSLSGLLDCARFDKTDSAIFNAVLRRCAWAYFGTKKLRTDANVAQANVITHMTKEFPPCAISDGNAGTFTDQARDMADRAAQLGICHSLKLFPKAEAKLGHGFETGTTPQAKEAVDTILQFLEQLQEETK